MLVLDNVQSRTLHNVLWSVAVVPVSGGRGVATAGIIHTTHAS